MINAEQLVNREVSACVSYLVAALAKGYGDMRDEDLSAMAEQASELCMPIADYEEAAIQAGWTHVASRDVWVNYELTEYASAEAVCQGEDIEPYEREVYEHWIVSDWLAHKLSARGEKVDMDFAGLTVWARTTTGQGIASDSVIEAIVSYMSKGA